MKKPFLFMLLLCSTIVGCKKNADPIAEPTITGKWYIKTLINTGGPNQGTFTGFTNQDYYNFGTDNNITVSNSQGVSGVFKYTYTKDTPMDKVVLSTTDRADTYLVVKLSTDSLVLRNTLTTVFNQPVISNNTPILKFARK